MRCPRLLLACLSALAVVAATPCWSTTLIVNPDGSGDFPNIQEAVDAAVDGDIVELGDGTFTGPGNFRVQTATHITIRSASGDPASCVIDCQDQGHAFKLGYSSEPGEMRVAGITIRNGREAFFHHTPAVGGIECWTTTTIENCVIVDCWADLGTGGIGAFWWSLVRVVGCVVSGNEGELGGGAFGWVSSRIEMVDCVISGNRGIEGGGIGLESSDLSLVGCTVVGNRATVGGAVLVDTGTVDGERCIVWGNAAATGPSLYLREAGDAAHFACSDLDPRSAGSGTVVLDGTTFSLDPQFCDPADPLEAPTAAGDYSLHVDSPCMPGHHPLGIYCGQIGALGYGGCDAVTVPEIAGGVQYVRGWPNPFQTHVILEYALSSRGPGLLTILDASGRFVRSMTLTGGAGRTQWDGRDASGSAVGSGVYFVRIDSGTETTTGRILAVR